MSFNPSESLGEGIASLWNSEKYSDLTITTQGRCFNVHKAIVCTQSKVFTAMSDAGFKESSTAILPLEHDNPAAIECMVKFLYTGDYDGQAYLTMDTDYGMDSVLDTILMLNVLVYSLADKYDIQTLKLLAEVKFEEIADGRTGEDFPAVVTAVFEATPSSDQGLRGLVCGICANHLDGILASEAWNEVLARNGAVSLAILKLVYQRSVARVDKQKKNH